MMLSELRAHLAMLQAKHGDVPVELQTVGSHLDPAVAECFVVTDTIDHPNPKVSYSRFRGDRLTWDNGEGRILKAFVEPFQTMALALPKSKSLVIQRES